MPSEELDALMSKLKAWCREEYGRQKQLAEHLGVTQDTMSHWLARRKDPSLGNYLVLREFINRESDL